MKALVVGGGGREHALAWGLSKSESITSILAVPGNPGIESLEKARCLRPPDSTPKALAELAIEEGVDLTVVGPEEPLVGGIADVFKSRGLRIFGPTAGCARLEGSKSFAKSLMNDLKVPTAAFATFESGSAAPAARAWLSAQPGPWVVKADGLAAGKGVLVTESIAEAHRWVDDCLLDSRFGDAGSSVIVEEYLEGAEVSLLALTDGKSILPLPAARDHKRLLDNDEGPNTGGMGAFSPVAEVGDGLVDEMLDTIIEPVLTGIGRADSPYIGILYAGLVLTAEGPKVLEFNVRFGDPETQVVIPRLDCDIAELFMACTEGRLGQARLDIRPDSCVTVVAASAGYPASPRKGDVIEGLNADDDETIVFHAGTAWGEEGEIVTAGGRVLAVSGLGDDIDAARTRAYGRLSEISFEGMQHRSDIGLGTS